MKYQNFISDRTKFYKIPKPLQLELGGTLNHGEIAYRTWGTLNAKGDNAVLICHGFSAKALVPPNEEQKVLFSKECRNLLSKLVNVVFEQKVPVHPVFVLGYCHTRFF